MSLSRYGDDLARAVAGELYGTEEAALRQHLSTCDECRKRYDALTLAARAVKGSAEPTHSEAQRAEARLLGGLEPKPATEPRPSRSFAWWALGIPVAVALVMGVVTTFVPPPLSKDEVVLRGAPEVPDASSARFFSVQLYAKPRDGGTVRLAGEFPGSGESRVSTQDWLQVKYAPDPRGGRVFAVNVDGQPRELPTEGSLALAAGPYRVWALHDLSMAEAEALEAAKPPWPKDALPVTLSPQVDVARGFLQVDP